MAAHHFLNSLTEDAMQAYAVSAPFDANFATHKWAVANVKDAGVEDDFSTVWPNGNDDSLMLDNVDDVVYFYGGRGAIYKALANFEYSRIRNYANGHRSDPIHVYRQEVKVDYGKKKQIIMLAIANKARDTQLQQYRDQQLEEPGSTDYRMREFRYRMTQRWPDIAGVDDD
jgi:hypothetical protein